MIQQLMRDANPCPCRGKTNINTAIQQVLKCEWADQEYKAAEKNSDRLSYRGERAERETWAGECLQWKEPSVWGQERGLETWVTF